MDTGAVQCTTSADRRLLCCGCSAHTHALCQSVCVCMLCSLHTQLDSAFFPLIQLSFGQYDSFWSLASLLMLAARTGESAGAGTSALHCWPRPSGAGRAALLSAGSRSHFLLTSVESSAE